MSKKHEEKVEIVPQGIPEVAPQFDQNLLPAVEPVPVLPPVDEPPVAAIEQAPVVAVDADVEPSEAEIRQAADAKLEQDMRNLGMSDDDVRNVLAEVVAAKMRDLKSQEDAYIAAARSQRQRHARQSNPKGWAGLDPSGTGTYEYVEFLVNGNRRLLVGGNNFEHVDTDADGVWLFRAMD